MSNTWVWKAKNSNHSRLLYEPGNWGDVIKAAWLIDILGWLVRTFGQDAVYYVDPFAGAPDYTLSKRGRFRIEQVALAELAMLDRHFISQDKWPSAANIAGLLLNDQLRQISVFDADAERYKLWQEHNKFTLWESDSGWTVLEAANPEATGLLLIDPYDFLADWRRYLPRIIAKAEDTSILLYLYNRSARGRDEFREYRDFRNNLDDLRGFLPKRIARVQSDSFLPRSHHEMLFLPSHAVMQHREFDKLLQSLENSALNLAQAVQRLEAIDC